MCFYHAVDHIFKVHVGTFYFAFKDQSPPRFLQVSPMGLMLHHSIVDPLVCGMDLDYSILSYPVQFYSPCDWQCMNLKLHCHLYTRSMWLTSFDNVMQAWKLSTWDQNGHHTPSWVWISTHTQTVPAVDWCLWASTSEARFIGASRTLPYPYLLSYNR